MDTWLKDYLVSICCDYLGSPNSLINIYLCRAFKTYMEHWKLPFLKLKLFFFFCLECKLHISLSWVGSPGKWPFRGIQSWFYLPCHCCLVSEQTHHFEYVQMNYKGCRGWICNSEPGQVRASGGRAEVRLDPWQGTQGTCMWWWCAWGLLQDTGGQALREA